ncbi:MAG: hypothetical protein GX657_02445 [Chloroflexi bacterium]|nr:hypothetical protein [Chloroflexota bacterium]
MADAIVRVRRLIADPAGAEQTFSDEEIREALEAASGSADGGASVDGGGEDVYGAAADLLEMWAAKEKLAYDFGSDGATYRRSQKAEALLGLAARYRRQGRVRVILQVRGDM